MAFNAKRELIHAGVHNAPRVSGKVARKLERQWIAWQLGEMMKNKRALPAKYRTRFFVMFPICNPELSVEFRLN